MRLLGKLRLEVRFLRAAHAGARRIAALRHEAVNYAVEYHAIIKAFPCQFLDARHMARRQLWQKLNDHPAFGQVHVKGVFKISHYCTVTFTILSGVAGGSPRSRRSTQNMPSSSTLPRTV